VIVPPTGVRVLIATKPVDFRKGMDGLAAYVEQAPGRPILRDHLRVPGQAGESRDIMHLSLNDRADAVS
jgi:hypothetical protein